MTPNQRDVFMYSWAQRRKRGRAGNALLCAAIGAAGGVLFGFLLAGDLSGQLTPGALASPSTHTIGIYLGNLFKLFGLSLPAFALLAAFLGDRVFMSNEAMYQNMIAQGAVNGLIEASNVISPPPRSTGARSTGFVSAAN